MSINSRLNTVAPDLIELGENLSSEQRKAIALRVAEWACRKTDVIGFLGESHMKRLLETKYPAKQQERQGIASNVENLDEKYFAIVEQHDGLDEAGEAMQWFRKARAAASVLYALDASTVQGFCEALYEAHAATSDLNGLKMLCKIP
jgi:hypothetical protein